MRLLIVDDDPDIRALLCAALCEEGHKVEEAPDGVAALEHLRGSAVSLIVLMDWQMPRLDGYGVLRRVAADPRLTASHRFVLITATDLSRDLEATTLIEHLKVPILRKPFSLRAVLTAVARAAADLDAAAPLPSVRQLRDSTAGKHTHSRRGDAHRQGQCCSAAGECTAGDRLSDGSDAGERRASSALGDNGVAGGVEVLLVL
jgi:CheY-like chemotaxis protein